MQIMRTTLNIDDDALTEAMDVSPGRTKTAVINDALREYARRHRVRNLSDLRSCGPWEGDLDELRKRRPR